MKKPIIAASSYLNAAPLCYSFVEGELRDRSTFIYDAAPYRCAELLAKKEADAALIPVIEYARIPDLKIAPGACVASRSKVNSVILVSKVPLPDIHSVALDTSSRTSAALVRVLLEHFLSLHPFYHPQPPNIDKMLVEHDAALIIGDPAMLVDRSSFHVYDLAEEWKTRTGLPFVFAFWAVRSESVERLGESGISFADARDEGLAAVGSIARAASERLHLAEQEMLTYLTQNISYDLDAETLSGLRLYYDLVHRCGLIDAVPDLYFLA